MDTKHILEQVLELKSITQKQLSSELEISEAVISKILDGTTTKPHFQTISKIKKYYESLNFNISNTVNDAETPFYRPDLRDKYIATLEKLNACLQEKNELLKININKPKKEKS